MTISSTATSWAFALALLFGLTSQSEAAPWRISTGKDLYEACKVLSDFGINPQGPTPRQGLYCRQFLAGYFTSLRYMNGDAASKEVSGVPVYAKDCIAIEGPRSFDQLASTIVHNGEWHPELMDKPAIELVRTSFGARPPC